MRVVYMGVGECSYACKLQLYVGIQMCLYVCQCDLKLASACNVMRVHMCSVQGHKIQFNISYNMHIAQHARLQQY